MKTSIIIRAYNAQETITHAVQSALSQEFPVEDVEILVINDGSTDGTMKMLDGFVGNPRVRVINQENKGPAEAANTGVRSSRGEYVTFLDSDDEFLPSLLAELVPVLDADPNIDFAYPDYYEEYRGSRKTISPKSVFENIMIGVVFRRDKLITEGLFRNMQMFPEYDLYLRIFGRWNGQHVSKSLFIYHRRTGSLTSETSRVNDGLRELERLHPDKTELIRQIRGYEF